jgi:FkbM family methyltransferase
VGTFRPRFVAAVLHRYPFLRGGPRVANAALTRALAGELEGKAWAQTRNGAVVLTPLDDFTGRATYFVGDTDPRISRLCRMLLRPGDVALDIGANIGVVTMLMSRLVGRTGRVHSFEPNPFAVDFLRASLERNEVTNVDVHQIALGAAEAVLPLVVPPGHLGNASFMHPADIGATIQVPVRRLSDVLESAGLTSIRLAKLDVEGYEREVLSGARPFFESVRPDAIITECWSLESAQGEALAQDLRDLGCDVFAIARTLMRLRLVPLGQSVNGAAFTHDLVGIRPQAITSEIADCIRSQ